MDTIKALLAIVGSSTVLAFVVFFVVPILADDFKEAVEKAGSPAESLRRNHGSERSDG